MNKSITTSTCVDILPDVQNRRALPKQPLTRGICEAVQFCNPSSDYPVSMVLSPSMEITLLPTEIVIPCEITTFAPEPYTLKCPPIKIEVRKDAESVYISGYHEANIYASGDSEYEAIENLKSVILDTFDSLTSEPEENLGLKAKHQRALLQSIIERE